MNPKVSVVVVAYNEEKLIGAAVNALLKQTVSKETYEIIVVDNGSNDQTSKICTKLGVKPYYYDKIQGCGPSRAFGSEKAKGSIIAYTDADCRVPNDWIERIEALLQPSHIYMISGQGDPIEKTPATKIIFWFYDIFYRANHVFEKPLVWGYTMALKKSAYRAIGGFDKSLLSSEDWDLAIRIQKKFGKKSVRYFPDLRVLASTRKQNNAKILWRYGLDGIRNYINLIILGKRRAIPVFNVR